LVDDGIILSVALCGSFYWANGMTDGCNTHHSMRTTVVVKPRISLGISVSFTLYNSSIGKTHHAEKKCKMLSHGFAGVLV
jgi:hypothetical protein